MDTLSVLSPSPPPPDAPAWTHSLPPRARAPGRARRHRPNRRQQMKLTADHIVKYKHNIIFQETAILFAGRAHRHRLPTCRSSPSASSKPATRPGCRPPRPPHPASAAASRARRRRRRRRRRRPGVECLGLSSTSARSPPGWPAGPSASTRSRPGRRDPPGPAPPFESCSAPLPAGR